MRRGHLILLVAAALGAWLWSVPAFSEVVLVRSGEHEGFSRIVVRPEDTSGWQFGRTDSGYELRFQAVDLEFDTRRVFDFIPTSRLAAVGPAPHPGALLLTVAPENHAIAFVTAAGAIAVDIRSGPAPEDSRFEAPIAPVAAATEPGHALPPADTATTTADTLVHPTPAPPAATPGAVPMPLATLARPSFKSDFGPDPRLEVYWRAPDLAATAPNEAEAENHAALALPAGNPLDQPAPPAEASAEATQATNDAHGAAAKAQPTAPAPSHSGIALPTTAPVASDRVAAAQADLLVQLARAASQGLIEPAKPQRSAPDAQLAVSEPAPQHSPPEAGTARLESQLSVHAETSMDREILSRIVRNPETALGDACLPDSALAVQSWGDDRPYLIQIAEARTALVGEFDIPDKAAVEKLARLYLFFGFGAEARDVQRAFDVRPRDAAVLDALAGVMEGEVIPDAGDLAAMADCDTAAALWAVLAGPALKPSDTINHGAVLRSFSGLPLHLRRQLGGELSIRFLGVGAASTARAVRDAIARAPGELGTTVTMIDARIGISEGNAKTAEALLDVVVADNSELSPEAVVMAINSRLERGAKVDANLMATAGAMAFEHRSAADGPVLAQAYILALGSEADFGNAFDELARWRASGTKRLQAETAVSLVALLTHPESAPVFLLTYFANIETINAAELPPELRMSLAERLLAEGFSDEARRTAGPEAALFPGGRQFLARAALADYDAATALRELAGDESAYAARLRGDALALLGRHGEATAAYLIADKPENSGAAAWRAGDWAQVSRLGSDAQKQAVTLFRLAGAAGATEPGADPAAIPDSAPAGVLARNRTLIDASQATRAAIDAILQEAALPPLPGG